MKYADIFMSKTGVRPLGAQAPSGFEKNYTPRVVVVIEQISKHQIVGEILSTFPQD